jgi:hypothetical protein
VRPSQRRSNCGQIFVIGENLISKTIESSPVNEASELFKNVGLGEKKVTEDHEIDHKQRRAMCASSGARMTSKRRQRTRSGRDVNKDTSRLSRPSIEARADIHFNLRQPFPGISSNRSDLR